MNSKYFNMFLMIGGVLLSTTAYAKESKSKEVYYQKSYETVKIDNTGDFVANVAKFHGMSVVEFSFLEPWQKQQLAQQYLKYINEAKRK